MCIDLSLLTGPLHIIEYPVQHLLQLLHDEVIAWHELKSQLFYDKQRRNATMELYNYITPVGIIQLCVHVYTCIITVYPWPILECL